MQFLQRVHVSASAFKTHFWASDKVYKPLDLIKHMTLNITADQKNQSDYPFCRKDSDKSINIDSHVIRLEIVPNDGSNSILTSLPLHFNSLICFP